MPEKRILLIHPLGYDPLYAGKDIARLANLMPPLGLASLASYLEKEGIKADIVDCFAHPDSLTRIKEYLSRYRPEFIGLSCTTSGFPDALQIIRLAKEQSAKLKSIVGGAHVSALKEKILADHPIIDYVVAGEGETPLRDLICSEGQNLQLIKGLCWRLDNIPVFNGVQRQLLDLDSLPFPGYEKLEGFPEIYSLPIFNYPKRPNTSSISSRGCPYKCSYCDRSVFGSSFRYNSAKYLYQHLSYLKEHWGIRHINFYDDQFTLNRSRVLEFCKMLIDQPLGMTFNCAARAEHIDQELLQYMKKAGSWMISLGIENGDQKLLAMHRQNADLDMVAQKIKDIKSNGIRTKGLFMLGLPGETQKSIKATRAYARSLKLDDLNLAKFTPFPGSPLYQTIHNQGSFKEDYSKMDCMNFLFIPKGLSEELLEKEFQEFYKDHFTRPRTMYNYFSMLWKSPDSWKRFILSLPSFISFACKGKRIEQNSKNFKQRWSSKSLGSIWQHQFFYLLIRAGGPRLAYIFVYPVTLWYVLVYPGVRGRILPYIRHRFAQSKGLVQDLIAIYRLSISFAKVLVDRATVGIMGYAHIRVDFPEKDYFKSILEENKGAVLINSHAGSWQVAISALEYLQTPMSMLMQKSQEDIDRPYYAHKKRASPYKTIDPGNGAQAMLEMVSCLKNGEILGIMGDRAFGNDKNLVDVDFLGGKAWIPYSPYKLASATGAPCLVLLSRKTGYLKYTIRLSRVIRVPEDLGRKAENFRKFAQEYANELEKFSLDHPWQFFNFYDMWSK